MNMIEPLTLLTMRAELSDTRLDALARELARDLSRVGVKAKQAEAKGNPGERGVLSIIGQFGLDGIGGKLSASVLDVLKAYITREKSFSFTLSKPDGTKMEITAKNVGSADVA